MKEQSSLTAQMAAFGRAYHACHAKTPIFCDFLARELLGEETYRATANYVLQGLPFFAPEKIGTFADDDAALGFLVNTQIAPTPLARAAYCEEKMRAYCRKDESVVILGAGFDTFAFRERRFLREHDVFEVDHPLTQAEKLRRVERAGWEIPPRLHFVPTDFAKDDLAATLRDAGLEPEKKTFYVWLGVSMYLTQNAIETTLKAIAAASPAGAALVLDYADEGIFSSKTRRVQNMLAMALAGGEPMKTCFSKEELERTLAARGFRLTECLTSRDIDERYFSGRGDELSAFEHIGYAFAVKEETK